MTTSSGKRDPFSDVWASIGFEMAILSVDAIRPGAASVDLNLDVICIEPHRHLWIMSVNLSRQ